MREIEQKSIVFNADVANDLNLKAAEIDGRLFVFAYYEPKQCIGETAHYKFTTAIVNLYGLLWDCAPFIRSQLLTTREINPSAREHLIAPYLPQTNRKDESITKQFQKLANMVENIRSCYAHNNCKEFLSNAEKQEYQKKWLSTHTGCDYEQGPKNEDQWQKALDVVLAEADTFIDNLKKCLDFVKNCSYKDNIVSTWINNGILYWYHKNRNLLYNILAQKYLSRFNRGNPPRKVTRGDINRWITQTLRPLESQVNTILNSWTGRQAQTTLLSSWDNNTPLLPSDVIYEMVKSIDSLPPPHVALCATIQSVSVDDF